MEFCIRSVVVSICVIVGSISPVMGMTRRWSDQPYDFIVVGAGAAGAAIAARLSENNQLKVLLLEAGGFPLYLTNIPYFASGPIDGVLNWNFTTESQEHALFQYVDQKMRWPRGLGLGGSTIINGMVFTRGNKHDYNTWRDLGNEGWSYDDVLPFFRKLEDYRGPFYEEADRQFHSFGGPMTASQPTYRTNLVEAMLAAGQEFGLQQVDYNTDKQRGITYPVFILRNGTRCSTYKGYLQPIMNKRRNLEVVTNAFVTKISFDRNRRATGVLFTRNGYSFTAQSSKEVILSAGSIKSPHVLMLSGIGPAETLNRFKIPVIADRPGVGEHLVDHVGVLGVTFTANLGSGIHPMEATTENMELWERGGQGPFSVPFRTNSMAFFDSKFANTSIDFPDIELLSFQPPAVNLGLRNEVVGPAFVPAENLETLVTFPLLLRPYSVGYITIKSANPNDHPVIQPNYLADVRDVEVLLDAIKKTYDLMSRQPLLDLGVRRLGTILPGCENFEQYSDDYFRCQIRGYACTSFHPVGTCKMGPKSDSLAVVDSRLRVYGVSNLRVCDSSIFPTIPSGHTMLPSILVGEKAAHMILEDWKLSNNRY